MIKTITNIIFISVLIYSCGFKPMYKQNENSLSLDKISVTFKENASYEVQEELKSLFNNDGDDTQFSVLVDVREEIVPIIINTNGTVEKYQIDVAIFFDVSDKSGNLILSDSSVGFAQYNIQTSEIENDYTRRQMLRSATNDAASLMVTKIQSKLSLSDDN